MIELIREDINQAIADILKVSTLGGLDSGSVAEDGISAPFIGAREAADMIIEIMRNFPDTEKIKKLVINQFGSNGIGNTTILTVVGHDNSYGRFDVTDYAKW